MNKENQDLHLILKSPKLCVDHAIKVIEGRWKESEHIIRTKHSCLLKYLTFLHSKGIEFEPELLEGSPHLCVDYAHNVVKGKCPELEYIISTTPKSSYLYSALILGHERFPAGEKEIAKSSGYSHLYAKKVLKARFPEGEDAIARDAKASYEYAKRILKGRFEKGEEVIAANNNYRRLYIRYLDYEKTLN